MAETGEMLGGAFRVKRLLGVGGTSKVYLAESAQGDEFAIKEIPVGKAQMAGALAQLRMKEKLFHPSLVHIWRVWEERENLYVVMDYVKGIPLDEVLQERGALPQEQAVEMAMQICRALVYLHGFQPPVIYRDLKPANIIWQEDGRVKLIDFGAARQLNGKRRRDTMPLGTPGYAAPEQFGRRGRSDVRSDIYSFGVMLYHMLTGHDPAEPPYQIGRIREWNAGLSPALEKIIGKCTRQAPWQRFRDCETLLKALETYREMDKKQGKHGIGRKQQWMECKKKKF